MNKNILTKKFFKDNPVIELTVQQYVYTQILIPELMDIVTETVREHEKRAEMERESLQNENNPDVLIKMLRGGCDTINLNLVYERVLANEQVVIPIVLRKFKTSLNALFIENTVKILAKTEKNYSEELIAMIDDIASPYALSLICITLGFIDDEDAIPVLMDKFEYFKKYYPNETYEQGPLLGLTEIDARLQEKK